MLVLTHSLKIRSIHRPSMGFYQKVSILDSKNDSIVDLDAVALAISIETSTHHGY